MKYNEENSQLNFDFTEEAKKNIEEFDRVVHDSEVFDVLDKPHKVESNFHSTLDVESGIEYIKQQNLPNLYPKKGYDDEGNLVEK